MFLGMLLGSFFYTRFLCMRRDVSPRVSERVSGGRVFSACAEMFLKRLDFLRLGLSFLCMSRDVSLSLRTCFFGLSFSLHAQRCFSWIGSAGIRREVFSACAEMFLNRTKIFSNIISFLCMRRDVSFTARLLRSMRKFSLHAQRCFPSKYENSQRGRVFSACAEMFLSSLIAYAENPGFLCMRRDVSLAKYGPDA